MSIQLDKSSIDADGWNNHFTGRCKRCIDFTQDCPFDTKEGNPECPVFKKGVSFRKGTKVRIRGGSHGKYGIVRGNWLNLYSVEVQSERRFYYSQERLQST